MWTLMRQMKIYLQLLCMMLGGISFPSFLFALYPFPSAGYTGARFCFLQTTDLSWVVASFDCARLLIRSPSLTWLCVTGFYVCQMMRLSTYYVRWTNNSGNHPTTESAKWTWGCATICDIAVAMDEEETWEGRKQRKTLAVVWKVDTNLLVG